MTKSKPLFTVLLAVGCAFWQGAAAQTPAAGSGGLSPETFRSLHAQIRPQTGESHWMKVPWLTDLHDARVKAAAEGKPLLLSVSGKGLSIGMC